MTSRKKNIPIDENENAGSPATGEPAFLAVGLFRRPHGVLGEMLMEVYTDFPDRLKRGRTIYIGEQHLPLKIAGVRRADAMLLLSFDEYNDCDQVGILRNKVVYVRASEAPPLPEGTFYHHQIVGLNVLTEDGQKVGTVQEILITGANDVYIIKKEEGGELLLPAIEDVILDIRINERVMIVRLQEWA